MPNPDSRSRKPKPVAMRRASRLDSVLRISHQPTSAMPSTSRTWETTGRTSRSFQNAVVLGTRPLWVRGSATMPGPLPNAVRSADRHRVHQPALCPQIVLTAAQLQGRAFADVALEDLAVIADRLDDVDDP